MLAYEINAVGPILVIKVWAPIFQLFILDVESLPISLL